LPEAGGSSSFWRPVAERLIDLGEASLADGIAGATIATVSGGTHSFAEKHPDEVASVITPYLR
jgi:hypothetical protein